MQTRGGRSALSALTVIQPLAVVLIAALLMPAVSGAQEKRRVTDKEQAMRYADELINQERFGQAVLVLEPLCEEYPDLLVAAERLATCYIETGRADRAVEFLEGRIEVYGGHFPFARLLGSAYLDLGERDRALAAWRKSLGDDPRFARNYGLVGRLMMEAGFYEEAIEAYSRGARYEALARTYRAEVVRLERLLGRRDEAFREAVALLGSGPGLNVGDVRLLAGIYSESGFDEGLFAIVDSAAAANRGGRYDIARAVLLLEAGRYGEAERYIEGRGALADREFYSFIRYLSAVRKEREDAGFVTFYRRTLDEFLDLYPGSPIAPEVRMVLAESLRDEARHGDDEEENLRSALDVIDRVMKDRRGAPLLERAALLKADLLLEDLHRPRDAMDVLEGVDFRSSGGSRRAEEIRMKALIRAEAWREAETRFDLLASSGDSVKAAIGLYGKGMAHFHRGEYAESVESLSSLAESYPGSPWANDALETALLVGQALREGRDALDCYRSALSLRAAGKVRAAADSLGILIDRYGSSSLVPRALYERAELDLLTGDRGRSVGGFETLAEGHPLSDLAPRALERLAEIAREENPERAMELYEALLERYPDDPFLERIRRAYISLRRSQGEDG